MTKEKILLADASWHQPILGIDCPKCGEWNDYYTQFADHEWPTDICQSATRSELEGIEFECPECKAIFELDMIQY